MTTSRELRSLGLWASGASAVCSTAYVLAQLAEWYGLLGSEGGPNASSTPLGIIVLLLPSLLLGPAWVLTLAALREAVLPERKGFALAALAIGTAYAALTGLVYFVQLTFVGPRIAAGNIAGIELLLFAPYKSFLFAVDLYGYSLMCGSALLAGFALIPQSDFARARICLLATGVLIPALALQMTFPWLIWIGALWGVTFPLSTIFLWRGFAKLASAQRI